MKDVVDNQGPAEIGARIKTARKALDLTQDTLANMAQATSKRGIQDNEAGKTMPGGQMISTLVRAGINANWLLTGEGPMLLKELQATTAEMSPLDAKILSYVIEEVEKILAVRRKALPPDKKAVLIQLIYDYCAKTGTQDAGAVERFIRLVA